MKRTFEAALPALRAAHKHGRATRRYYELHTVDSGRFRPSRRVRKAARLVDHWDARADRLTRKLFAATNRPWKASHR